VAVRAGAIVGATLAPEEGDLAAAPASRAIGAPAAPA
jgi:hypothetical protein